jgi:hypothetical protein
VGANPSKGLSPQQKNKQILEKKIIKGIYNLKIFKNKEILLKDKLV